MNKKSCRLFAAVIALGILPLAENSAQAQRSASGKAFTDLVKIRPQVDGAPLPSDVCLSSRWLHPIDDNDPHDTFTYGDAVHATRLDWVYSLDVGRIKAFRDRGYAFGASMNSKLPDQIGLEPRKPGSAGDTYVKGRILDKEGNPVTATWMRAWKVVFWGCVNSPEYRDIFLQSAKLALDGGATTLHVDDPGMNQTAVKWGGCFCSYCKSKAEAEGIDLDDKKQMGSFQKESVNEFYRVMREGINAHAKRRVAMSSNNYQGSSGWPHVPVFDFGICEFKGGNKPVNYYNAMHNAFKHGRNQAFTLKSTVAQINHLAIATSYALGANLVVPWDVYIKTTKEGSERYYGEVEDYAPIFGFIRSMSIYLDGYHEAAVTGWTLPDHKEGYVHISGEQSVAVVRAKAKDKRAPVVVHVIDHHAEKSGQVLTLSAAALGFTEPKATLYTAVPYDKEANALAIKRAEALRGPDGLRGADQAEAFAGFRRVRPLQLEKNNDGTIAIALPELEPWGIVVIEQRK